MQGTEQRLYLACNVKGCVGAKQLSQVLWEDKIRNWAGYDFLLVKNPTADPVTLDGNFEMVTYRLLEGVRREIITTFSLHDRKL